jgi:diguanylate cyclase (GGDEF)-like protein
MKGHLKRTCTRAALLVLLGMLLGGTAVYAQSDAPLFGAWRSVRSGDTPAQVLAEAAKSQLIPFDTRILHAFPHHGLGSWVVLQPRNPGLSGRRVLSIPSPGFGSVTLYGPKGPITTTAINKLQPALVAHDRLAFAIPDAWPATAPILLKFEPAQSLVVPIKFHLQSRTAFRHGDLLWLSMASASLAVMLAMALVAVCFSMMLGDATFAWYAGYVTGYAGLQAIQTGFVFHPLQWSLLTPVAIPVGSSLTALSVICAVLFMVRFCNLRKHAPWLRTLLLTLSGIMALLALLTTTGIPGVRRIVQTLFNPLLALCSGLMVLGSSMALLRGSRSALFFLFGWLPLLVLTALTSAQVGGALPGVDWLNRASLVAGAIEALVLAVGLADHSLTMRRDHDLARELANKDPLTGVLNRRAWIDAAQLGLQDAEHTQALLFMDLDHFKTLNDELGHRAGDQALVAMAETFTTELRPQDLLGRFGGEEFVALLRDTDRDDALQVAQRLCRRMHRMEIPLDREGALLTISIGMATRRPNDTLSSLVERADAAMYTAKSQGRNRVVDERDIASKPRHVIRPSHQMPDLSSALDADQESA